MSEDASSLDDLVRHVDPDRWLSSRFIADPQARADVIALYAFDHELGRAPKVASSSLLGEIRLTWWREVLDEVFEGRAVRHHPTAQALADVVRRRGLPRESLEAMIDGRYRELDETPMSDADALEWARDTAGAAAVISATILDSATDVEGARSAGAAWALAKRNLPSAGEMAVARVAVRRLSVPAFPAVAHAALVGGAFARRLRITWAVARGRI